MVQPTVLVRNLTKIFDDTLAVDDLSFQIEAGQFVALLGPSGCGKTTTLRLLAGFETPDSGVIEIGGRQVNGHNIFVPPEKRKIGMVFQSYALFPHLTVEQNIAYGLSRKDVQSRRVDEILALVRLPHVKTRFPHELSGGQQQRVALARALAPRPDLILLDEPFSNLDTGLRVAVRREVHNILFSTGATTLFVTHDQEEALSLADSVAVIMRGKLKQIAPPHILYQKPISKDVAAFVGDANFLPATVDNGVISCEFGKLAAVNKLSGPVEVMLRPEAVKISPNVQGIARVSEYQFFGHTQLVTCTSDSGTRINVRLSGANEPVARGDRVDVILPENATVFSRK